MGKFAKRAVHLVFIKYRRGGVRIPLFGPLSSRVSVITDIERSENFVRRVLSLAGKIFHRAKFTRQRYLVRVASVTIPEYGLRRDFHGVSNVPFTCAQL